ncbi:MAG: twin-arginine translocase subunit TatC [Anaeromyxobacter sp.]
MAKTHEKTAARRLLLALGGVAAGWLVSLPFGSLIIAFLLSPVRAALPPGHQRIVYLHLLDPLSLMVVKGPLFGAVLLATPWVLWQLWQLLAPVEHRGHRGLALRVAGVATALLYAGVAFAYWMVLPNTLPLALAPVEGIAPMVSVSDAFGLVVMPLIVCGLLFELPLAVAIMVVLSRRPEAPSRLPAGP